MSYYRGTTIHDSKTVKTLENAIEWKKIKWDGQEWHAIGDESDTKIEIPFHNTKDNVPKSVSKSKNTPKNKKTKNQQHNFQKISSQKVKSSHPALILSSKHDKNEVHFEPSLADLPPVASDTSYLRDLRKDFSRKNEKRKSRQRGEGGRHRRQVASREISPLGDDVPMS
ncbi:hypothetical protein Fcan01_09061 [Folsomia candida]|uniref:Uncharacterized protein n=1 Tax=Folsomia candida TaxID=158441 RepID=A0A226ECK7_FOLCA|nr:hypothetical protein Fcan01_09061 [Folsomia candida]